jgi:hypothetical protein
MRHRQASIPSQVGLSVTLTRQRDGVLKVAIKP